MSLIYSLIGLGQIIFAEYTDFSGNFALTANKILKACKDTKYTKYPSNNYIFYILNCECIFLVMCDRQYPQRIAFSYLQTIRKMFTSTFSQQKIEKGKMYEMMEFSPVLKTQMHLYNEPQQVDKVAKLMKETNEVSKIIEEDLQKAISRGQKIEILARKTQTMVSLSLDFKSTSRQIKNQMTWKNWKMKILIGLVIVALIYFILVLACGGFTLSRCF